MARLSCFDPANAPFETSRRAAAGTCPGKVFSGPLANSFGEQIEKPKTSAAAVVKYRRDIKVEGRYQELQLDRCRGGIWGRDYHHLSTQRKLNCCGQFDKFSQPCACDRKKSVSGLVAAPVRSFSARPISRASRPASIALLNARAMRTESDAIAIAVFTKTASAPISIASAA